MPHGFFVYVLPMLRISRYVLSCDPDATKRLMNYTGFRPPFRLCTNAGACVRLCSSGSGEDSEKDVSLKASILGTGGVLSILDIPRFIEQGE